MASVRTLALVESATQLLNVAEWADASGEAAGLRVDVLCPNDRRTVRQIERVARLVEPLGMDVRTVTVRSRTAATPAGIARVGRDVAAARRLVVGDPFSRMIQTLLPLSRAEHVVVVDDGTATWEFARCIDAGRPMVRWNVAPRGAEWRATRATALFSPAADRRLTVFSCLNRASPVGAEALANNYGWARSWRRPEVVEGQVDVLGVSLVDTGVVERDSYVAAVARLAARHERVRYLPHRRESAGLVARIGTIARLSVVRSDLPVELSLREGPVSRRVVTFPSTAAHTLPVVLSDLGLQLEVRRVEESWFTASTTGHARRFVARIADAAPLPPVLETVSSAGSQE